MDNADWFFEGYGETSIDPHRLTYYRSVRALVDVGDYAAEAIDVAVRGRPDRGEALSTMRGVLSGTGLVQLALSTRPFPL